jgi:hypothetical protein
VWDPTGDALSGAVLTAVEEKSGRQSEAVSDSDGRYAFLGLQPGVYTVTVKAKGFKDVVHRNISVFTPGTISEDFSFEVSGIDKESATAELPRTNESENNSALSRRELEALPNLDRNPLSLVIYQPGVQTSPDNPGIATVNGTRTAMNGVGLDGVSVTDPIQPQLDASSVPVSPDTISDLQIVTTGAKAEYGRSAGAQITMTSRPGTKSWSGDVYDYFRNRMFNANNFINNARSISRPQFTRNIYGGTLSGPAFGSRNLLFLNFEGNHTDQKITRNRMVLTDEAKLGVFRWLTPGTTTENSFNILQNDPRHLGVDAAIAPILAKLPSPNNFVIGDGFNTAGYMFNNPAYLNKQGVNLRLDHYSSPNHQLFVRFNWDRIDSTDLFNGRDKSFPDASAGTYLGTYYGVMAGSDWMIGPLMLNELRVGYSRPEGDFSNPARLTTPMFVANSWTNPFDPSFPRTNASPMFGVSDYLSRSRHTHTFKFGGSFSRIVQSTTDYSGVYPNVTSGLTMGNNVPTSIGPSGVAVISNAEREVFENLYNDLLGRIESVSRTFNSTLSAVSPAGTPKNRDYVFNEFAGFVQDDWKIRENLTLNLGLRYEMNMSPREKNGYQSILDQAGKIGPLTNISNFKVLPADSWYSKDLTNFSPRVGFAWDPFRSGTLVIRGSYGIYYDRLIGAVTNFVDQSSYGFSQDVTVYPNAAGGDVRLSDGVPLPSQPAALAGTPPTTRSFSIAVFDPNLRTPRVDQFSLSMEKRLFGAIWEASYVGTRGTGLFQTLNLNQTKTGGDFLKAFNELQAYRSSGTPVSSTNTLVRIFGSPIAALNAIGGSVVDSGQAGLAADTLDRDYFAKYAAAGISDSYIRNYPQFNTLLYGSSSGRSWYNSLQLGLRKSTRNLNLRAHYTWSRSLDTISSNGGTFVSPSDSLNPGLNKAPSDFDRTHVFNVAVNYALPFGRNPSSDADTSKFMSFLFGGWNVGVLYLRESGSRFSVSTGLETRFAGVNSLADYSGSRNIGGLYQQYGTFYFFSPEEMKEFTYPTTGQAATSGRNSFIGPGFANFDAVLQKRFLVRENRGLQFRIEAFNVLNRAQFANPVSNLSDSYFGIVTSTQGYPRRMQISLRYQF